MARYLDPKNDVVFKKVFGQNPHLLISFLNSQLTFENGSVIESIKYLKDELIPDNPFKKRSIVDVRCTDNFKREFIVEMQMEWVDAFFERMLFNTAAIYSRQLKRGNKHLQLQPVYGLAILNDNFDKETDEYYHSFEMMNPKNPKEKIAGMNIVFIELEKFVPKTKPEKELAVLWLRFLKEIDETACEISSELKENELIKEALELCEEAAYTDEERLAYDKYWDEIRCENLLIEGKFAEGKAEGKAEGVQETQTEFILNMDKEGFCMEQIAKIAKISIEKVKEILNKK
ncbi:MAG: Rpn family recombination-promoting nuclease/putative transposase [Prevotellaceae bacterium]|jgi:predicted transposase/invertase (TIGR01784 family)|nr:Rpn family recombination-promoting nuclease/putative transposase [Prevotellaceae bacterium]